VADFNKPKTGRAAAVPSAQDALMRILLSIAQGNVPLILSDGLDAVAVRVARCTTTTMDYDSPLLRGDSATGFAAPPQVIELTMQLTVDETSIVENVPRRKPLAAASQVRGPFLPGAAIRPNGRGVPAVQPPKKPEPKTGKEARFEDIITVPDFEADED